ncbi:MAG: hypothetical protein RMZ69_30850 [Nostoc sp. ChiQUE01a]|nr:hypothetical protein [Nostoc sp. ChiQUE01a]
MDDRKDFYNKQLAQKKEELTVIQLKLEGALDSVDELKLNNQAEATLQKIEELEAKLNNLSSQTGNANRSFLALEQKLPKIDFKEQITKIKNILEDLLEYRNAIFLINDSLYMAGDLFSIELKKILEEDTTDLKYYPIVFTVGGSLDEIGFLQGLAGYLGIGNIQSKDDYDPICNKLNSSIVNGSIIFIEIKKIDLLDNKDSFLCWLLNIFCKFLNDNLVQTCQSKGIELVKLIILVSSDDDILEECSSLEIFCDGQVFKENRIFPITLSQWSEQDINLWLKKYSGLPKNQITAMAKSIFRSSRGGTPKLICEALRSKLS